MPEPGFAENVERLFHEALNAATVARADFLKGACQGDAELRQAVERLLVANNSAAKGSVWERTALETLTGSLISESSIDRYRLLNRLGEGGMGVVYEAVRADDAYSKRVAIKIVNPIAAAGSTLARRFRTERQILAGLEHPNIARLLDGGETAEGLPFLVMEYVEGLPLDGYVLQNRLSRRAI